MSFLVPRDPFELAAPFAEHRFGGSDFSERPVDSADLVQLDGMAEKLGLFGTYFVDSGRAMITPVSFNAEDEVNYVLFGGGLSFEGKFATYSYVQIGRIIGGGAVRALCATFSTATLMPYFDQLPQTDLLHVPILAAESVVSTS